MPTLFRSIPLAPLLLATLALPACRRESTPTPAPSPTTPPAAATPAVPTSPAAAPAPAVPSAAPTPPAQTLSGCEILKKFATKDEPITHADSDAPTLKDSEVWHVHLGNTAATDADLAALDTMPQLSDLSLQNTKITDAGLAHLQHASKMEQLYLNGTQVTDTGLAQLHNLPRLSGLDVRNTKVTRQAALAFVNAAPNKWIAVTFSEKEILRKPKPAQ